VIFFDWLVTIKTILFTIVLVPYYLTFSLTHTHTHTHTFSYFMDFIDINTKLSVF